MNITDQQVVSWLHQKAADAKISGLLLTLSTQYADNCFSARIKESSLYFGWGNTADQAIADLRRQFPDARARARQLREEAKRKAAEADMIEEAASVTPLKVIAELEGAA